MRVLNTCIARQESGVAGGLGPAEPAPGDGAEARDSGAGGDHRGDAGAAGGARAVRRQRADVGGGDAECAQRRAVARGRRAAAARVSRARTHAALPAPRTQLEARPLRAAHVRRRPARHQQTLLGQQLPARLHAAGAREYE